MRFILIPAIALALLSIGLTTQAAAKGVDTCPILADDSEKKKDREDSEGNTTGDDEPECE